MQNLYRGRYFIALYSENDIFYDCYDNVLEMSKKIKRKLSATQNAITELFNKNLKHILIDGVKYKCYFIKAN